MYLLFQLLVNSKIISLDLPVKDVYKKIWCPEGEVCTAMWNILVCDNLATEFSLSQFQTCI